MRGNKELKFIFYTEGLADYVAACPAFRHQKGSGKINIIELNDGFIRGTFECVVIQNRVPVLTSKTITNGEFKMKRS